MPTIEDDQLIAKWLREIPQGVKVIDASRAYLDADYLGVLLKALAAPESCVRELNLYANLDDFQYKEEDSKANTALLAHYIPLTRIQNLDLGCNQMTDACCHDIAHIIRNTDSLVELYLRENEISAVGAELIANALKEGSKIERLCLLENPVDDLGAWHIAEALPHTKLKYLNLSTTRVQTSGAMVLAQVLPKCPTLETLDLYANYVSPEGMKALGAALKNSPNIKELVVDRVTYTGQKLMDLIRDSC